MAGRIRIRAQRSARGFTLIEALVAMSILAMGLLTLAVMQLEALSQGSAGRHTGDAAATARSYLEQVQRIPWTELDGAAGSGWIAPTWLGAPPAVNMSLALPGAGGNAVEHAYNINWRVTEILDGVGNPNPCLRTVEVRVGWSEEKIANKTLALTTRRYNWGAASC